MDFSSGWLLNWLVGGQPQRLLKKMRRRRGQQATSACGSPECGVTTWFFAVMIEVILFSHVTHQLFFHLIGRLPVIREIK